MVVLGCESPLSLKLVFSEFNQKPDEPVDLLLCPDPLRLPLWRLENPAHALGDFILGGMPSQSLSRA